jgi:hypothetical protein
MFRLQSLGFKAPTSDERHSQPHAFDMSCARHECQVPEFTLEFLQF